MAQIERHIPTIDDLNQAVSSMIEGKTDREIAILGGGLLEGMLFDLLQATLVDSQFQRLKGLFKYPGPLSSFGSMLSLAFAFGRISLNEFHLMGIIKNIRNYAAHSVGISKENEFSFSKEPVRSMLHEFNPRIALERLPKAHKDAIRGDFDKFIDYDSKMVFRLIFCSAEVHLLGRRALAVPIEIPAEINEGLDENERPDKCPSPDRSAPEKS